MSESQNNEELSATLKNESNTKPNNGPEHKDDKGASGETSGGVNNKRNDETLNQLNGLIGTLFTELSQNLNNPECKDDESEENNGESDDDTDDSDSDNESDEFALEIEDRMDMKWEAFDKLLNSHIVLSQSFLELIKQ